MHSIQRNWPNKLSKQAVALCSYILPCDFRNSSIYQAHTPNLEDWQVLIARRCSSRLFCAEGEDRRIVACTQPVTYGTMELSCSDTAPALRWLRLCHRQQASGHLAVTMLASAMVCPREPLRSLLYAPILAENHYRLIVLKFQEI